MPATYRDAGVDIGAGQRAIELMRDAVQSTHTAAVLAGIGAFGGLFDAAALKQMTAPVLVASTDGVGTKVKVAARLNRFDTIGTDLVHHCVDDILVQGARPLFFLDYIAAARLDPAQVAAVVSGMAAACRAVGCVLLGGETAEMPGVYADGEFDAAGSIVGVVERDAIIDGRQVQPGDSVIGLASTGLHTNGYSLARRVLPEDGWQALEASLGEHTTIGDALLAVHRCYLPQVDRLQTAGIRIHALAHITGGGLLDNIPRSLPDGLGVDIRFGSWSVPPIFRLIRQRGDVSEEEMFHTFNMGIGMVVVTPAADAGNALDLLGREAYRIGEVVVPQSGAPRVHIG